MRPKTSYAPPTQRHMMYGKLTSKARHKPVNLVYFQHPYSLYSTPSTENMSRMPTNIVSKQRHVNDRDRLSSYQGQRLTFDTPDFECPQSWRSPSVSSKPFKHLQVGSLHSTSAGSVPKMANAFGSEHRAMSVSSDSSSGSSGEGIGLVELRSTKGELLWTCCRVHMFVKLLVV